jgi:bacterial/archaeal transporter family-2 protein
MLAVRRPDLQRTVAGVTHFATPSRESLKKTKLAQDAWCRLLPGGVTAGTRRRTDDRQRPALCTRFHCSNLRAFRGPWGGADSLERMSVQPAEPSARRRSAHIGLVALGVVCGAGVATQSRINGQLGSLMHDGFAAALISFGSGLIIVLIGLIFLPKGRRGIGRVATAIRQGDIPFWYVLGGAGGAFLVLSQGLVAATLGVALFSVGIVAGQTIGGTIVDRRGLGSMPARALTVQRLVGSALALAAVVVAASTQLSTTVPVWMLVLPFVAGLLQSAQQAVNGQIRAVSESVATATLANFAVGTIVLAVAFLIHSIIAGWPTRLPSEPWVYLGGAIGVVFIAVAAAIVRSIGVLLLSLATIAGQLVTSLLLDILVPTSREGVTLTTILGTVLTLVAVVIAAIPSRIRSTK